VLGDERLLAERLGEGVGVGPAEGLGPCGPAVDQLALHPILSDLLGPGGEEMLTRTAEFAAGLLGETGQLLGPARLGLEVGAKAACRIDLGAPVGVDGEAVLREQFLSGLALVRARHVRRRHGDQVCGAAAPLPGGLLSCPDDRRGHPRGPEHVDLDRLIEWGIEADGCCRVDGDVTARELGASFLVEPEPVAGDVTSHRGDAGAHLGVEAIPSSARRRSKQSFFRISRAVRWVGLARRPSDQEHELYVGHGAQQSLHQRGPEEAGAPGDEDPLAAREAWMPIRSVYHLVGKSV